MTSIVGQVMDAVITALETAPAVATQVARVRLRPWSEATTTAVAVRPLSADREQSTLNWAGPDVWAVRVGVECYARASSEPDVAVDDLLDPAGLSYDFDAAEDHSACATFVLVARMVAEPSFT
jgi:hypothetical protein